MFVFFLNFNTQHNGSALFPPPPPPPTSLKHEFYGLTSGFTRLIMKTKYVCHGRISLHVNFHDNRTKRLVISNIKISRCGGGGKEKEPTTPLIHIYKLSFKNLFHKLWKFYPPGSSYKSRFFKLKIVPTIEHVSVNKATC